MSEIGPFYCRVAPPACEAQIKSAAGRCRVPVHGPALRCWSAWMHRDWWTMGSVAAPALLTLSSNTAVSVSPCSVGRLRFILLVTLHEWKSKINPHPSWTHTHTHTHTHSFTDSWWEEVYLVSTVWSRSSRTGSVYVFLFRSYCKRLHFVFWGAFLCCCFFF